MKIGDKIYVLEHHDIEEAYVEEIYEDYEEDESMRKCKWVKHSRGDDRMRDVYETEYMAERAVEMKKIAYDHYVTRGY